VAEVGVAGAGREDQEVVVELAVREPDAAPIGVDADDVGEQDSGVALVAEDRPDRIRDVSGRERGGRDLVEQRLKEVMVAPVDHGHADGRVGEPSRRRQPPEPGADDDDVGQRPTGGHRTFHSIWLMRKKNRRRRKATPSGRRCDPIVAIHFGSVSRAYFERS
jgi:hypothetical protein